MASLCAGLFNGRENSRLNFHNRQFGEIDAGIAATHDTGIDFSEQNRTFIHKIDSQIDRERAKVVNDLLFTGRVRSVALVDRPAVPQHGQNATGDGLETDAKMAVLILQ